MTAKYNKIVMSIPHELAYICEEIENINREPKSIIPIVTYVHSISNERLQVAYNRKGQSRVDEICDEHRAALNELTAEGDLLVNFYTFSNESAQRDDIKICFGYNDDESRPDRETIQNIRIGFVLKYSYGTNKPFTGSVLPRTQINYKSVMIGINDSVLEDPHLKDAILKVCCELNMLVKELVFYDRPPDAKGRKWIEMSDKDGKTFWVDWHKRLSSKIVIKSSEEINELPKEIAALIPKWEREVERLKSEKYNLPYYVKGAHIDFIYDDKFYSLRAEALPSTMVVRQARMLDGSIREYMNNAHELFSGARKMFEDDLREVGCMYINYTDFLD